MNGHAAFINLIQTVTQPARRAVAAFAVSLALVVVQVTLSFAGATGGQPGQFLSWGAGARSLGMGKAFFAIANDASATYWNPAGLPQLDRKEVMALHVNLFADTTYDFISYVHPTPNLGVFGVNLTRLFSSGFEKVAITFDPTKTDIIDIQNMGTFDDSQTALTFAYGKRIRENISIGGSFKYITHTLDTSTNGFATFDLTSMVNGVTSTLPDMKLAFGLNNILSTAFGDTEDKLPMIFRAGVSQPFLKNKLLLALDMEKGMRSNMNWHIGTEYWLLNFAAIRVGFEGQQGISETSAGFGLRYRDYAFDYSFALHELGLSHRISGSWRFGLSVNQNKEALVRRYIQEGMEAYAKGNFLLAHNRMEAALDVDPTNKDVQKMGNRLQLVIGYIPAAKAENEEETAIRKGVAAYTENDDKGAINAFRYAYYKNPANMKLLQLLNALEREMGITVTPVFKEEASGFTMLDQKIYDARQAVIEGKYDQALIKCQEIMNLEPENVTALEMMGSAFFMMDQPEKAKQIWMKVIEIDPSNKVVPEFLNQLK